MIDALIRWSLHNRLIVLTLAAILLGWGGWQAVRLPVDVLPDLTAPTVTILVEGHGIAPEEMESLVTFPIEAALNGAAGVRRVRSVTAVGAAIVWVEFDWGEDIYRARQTVNEKLGLVAGSLPDTVEPPVLAPVSSIMGEILFLALESERHSMLDVRTTADTIVRRRILSVPGVSQVTTIGGAERQYQVLVSPDRLEAYRVTLGELEHALREANRNTSAGFRVSGGQEYLILKAHTTDSRRSSSASRSSRGRTRWISRVASTASSTSFKLRYRTAWSCRGTSSGSPTSSKPRSII